MATSGRWARTLRSRSSPSPACRPPRRRRPRAAGRAAARTSSRVLGDHDRARRHLAPAAARLAVEVQDELDGRRRRCASSNASPAAARSRAMPRTDAQNPRASVAGAARICHPRATRLSATARSPSSVEPRERLPDARREIGAVAHEQRGLDEVEQRGRGQRGAARTRGRSRAGCACGAPRARPRPRRAASRGRRPRRTAPPCCRSSTSPGSGRRPPRGRSRRPRRRRRRARRRAARPRRGARAASGGRPLAWRADGVLPGLRARR